MTIRTGHSGVSSGYPLPPTTGARNISDRFKVLKDILNQAIILGNTQIIQRSLSKLINENVYINEPLNPIEIGRAHV